MKIAICITINNLFFPQYNLVQKPNNKIVYDM